MGDYNVAFLPCRDPIFGNRKWHYNIHYLIKFGNISNYIPRFCVFLYRLLIGDLDGTNLDNYLFVNVKENSKLYSLVKNNEWKYDYQPVGNAPRHKPLSKLFLHRMTEAEKTEIEKTKKTEAM